MLLIASGRLIDGFAAPGVSTRRFQRGPLDLLVAHDQELTRLDEGENGFTLVQSFLPSASLGGDRFFIKITADAADGSLRVSKSTDAGKALYYHISAQGELVISTHLQLLRACGLRLEEDSQRVPEFFRFRFVSAPHTLLKGVRQLACGDTMDLATGPGGWSLKRHSRFQLPDKNRENIGLTSLGDQALASLQGALAEYLPPAQPGAVLFSGGLDSSLLLGLCQRLEAGGVGFSASFPFEDPQRNLEHEYAHSAAQAIGGPHQHYQGDTRHFLEAVIRATKRAEYPIHHIQTAMIYLLLSQQMDQEHRWVFCGDGADGVWGNTLAHVLWRNQMMPPYSLLSGLPLFSKIRPYLGRLAGRGERWGSSLDIRMDRQPAFDDPAHLLWSIHSYGNLDWICGHFGVSEKQVVQGRMALLEPFADRDIYDLIALQGFLDESTATQPVWSKLGEAHGKVLLYPYYQPGHLDFALSIPWALKLTEPKAILRRVAGLLGIPQSIVTRPKSAFGLNLAHWARPGGIMEPLVSLAAKEVEPRELRALQSADKDLAMLFWSMLTHALWRRLVLNDEPEETLLAELAEAVARQDAAR